MICQFSINLMKQIRINNYAYNVAVFVRQMGVNCFYSHFKWNIRCYLDYSYEIIRSSKLFHLYSSVIKLLRKNNEDIIMHEISRFLCSKWSYM